MDSSPHYNTPFISEESELEEMDISAIEGQELTAVEFVSDYLRLRFEGPMLTLYAWPHVLLADFSVAYGEPEYRNAICAQIGETVAKASLEELDALTVELESGTVIALSLRGEDLDGPEAGSYSADGSGVNEEDF
ncbi:MAG: hypothetical protein V4555_15610 [Acidobacteriota bacterium]